VAAEQLKLERLGGRFSDQVADARFADRYSTSTDDCTSSALLPQQANMAEFDIGQLTPTQQEALQQYTQVTDQEINDAVPILERSQWNVQV
jgi:hypothetical protein